MYKGYVDKITRSMVQGWALDAENPDRSVEVLVFVNGAMVTRTTANLSRPDLAAENLGSGHNGFSTHLPFQLDTASTQTVEIRFADTNGLVPQGTCSFAPLDDSRVAKMLAAVHNTTLSPILATHIARSGTIPLIQTAG